MGHRFSLISLILSLDQEIEEDKKKAEQEGIAVTTPRKPRPHEPETDRRKTEKENLTVTVEISKQTGVRHDVGPFLVFLFFFIHATLHHNHTCTHWSLKTKIWRSENVNWHVCPSSGVVLVGWCLLSGLWRSCRRRTDLINSDRFSLLCSVYQPHACYSTHNALHQSSAHVSCAHSCVTCVGWQVHLE